MRKTSHEGADSTSVTSGVENEIKKTGGTVGKSKRNSIKKKIPNFSQESDVTVTEPLLQTEKEGIDYVDQSANESILKAKTEINNKNERDDIIILENKVNVFDDDVPRSAQNIHENVTYNAQPNTTGAIHNHMNTNIFSSLDTSRSNFIPKTQTLVDIDGCKQVDYSSNPLIFTTAKIHSDEKNKHMEPVQVTPVPILSTVEVSVSKAGKCSETNSNIVQTIASISNTNFEREPKNTVPFSKHTASMQLQDTISKSISSVPTQGEIFNKVNVSNANNTTTKDSIKAIKTTESYLPKSINTKNIEGNILLQIHQVSVTKSNTVFKDKSSVKVMKSPIVHSTVTETPSIDTKLSSNLIMAKSQQTDSMKPTKLKNLEPVISIPSQQKNNQGTYNLATEPNNIINNNKKEDVSISITNKILPRQKDTITENLNELIVKPKYIEGGSSDYDNGIKSSKDLSGKIKSPIKPKIVERDSCSISDQNLPKTSINNLVSNISNPSNTTAFTEITKLPAGFTSGTKSSVSSVPSCMPTTTLRTTTTSSNIPSSDYNIKKSSTTKSSVNILGTPSTEAIYSNKSKVTKPTTPISSANVSPVTSSISQNVTTVKSCPSNSVKTTSLPTKADKSSISLATPLSTSKLSTSKFSNSSLSSDKQVGNVNSTAKKTTTNNIVEGQSKLSMTTESNGRKPKDMGKDDKGVKS